MVAEAIDVREYLDRSRRRLEPTTGDPTATLADEGGSLSLLPRTLPLQAWYDDPETGERLEATVHSVVPGFEQKNRMARMEADLCSGRSFQTLSLDQQLRFRALARVTVQLDEAPPWVLKWAAEDDSFLTLLANYCAMHETLFFRSDNPAGGQTPGRARMAVSSAVDHVFREHFQPTAGAKRSATP